MQADTAVRVIDGIPVRPLTAEITPEIRITIYDASVSEEILEQAIEDANIDPYASILWPSALAVARELPDLVSPGDYVVDLGSGTGLATLTAAHLGANVTAYDHDRFALHLIEAAAHLQGLDVETIHFDLHSSRRIPPADLMIVADLLYDYDLAFAVGRRVLHHVRNGGRAIIGDPGRIASADFLKFLEQQGIHGDFSPTEVSPPGHEGPPMYVGIHLFGE